MSQCAFLVFIKYKQDTSDAHIDEFIRRRRALTESIPVLRDLEVGRDALHTPRSWDVMLAMHAPRIRLGLYSENISSNFYLAHIS